MSQDNTASNQADALALALSSAMPTPVDSDSYIISAAAQIALSNAESTTGLAPAKQATPTFSPVAGPYVGSQSVTIASTGADSIYYTTDGSTPTANTGTLYSTTVTVAASKTLKALAVKAGKYNSAVGSAAYVIS